MRLTNIIKAVKTLIIEGDTDKEISGINIDSRLIQKGHMFIAVKGTQSDGHSYIDKAIENGATAIVCETLPEQKQENVTYIQMKDTEGAVGKLATTFSARIKSSLVSEDLFHGSSRIVST